MVQKFYVGNQVGYLLTTGTTSWTVPSNWNNSDNTIVCIGGGGGGSNPSTNGSGGGGGGAFASSSNIPLTPGATIPVTVAQGGNAGDSAHPTSFNSGAIYAAGGGAGSNISGGQGGSATSCIGDVKFAGGNGGYSPFSYQYNTAAGGGGGAGGPGGPGGPGGNVSSVYTLDNTGGSGGGGAGGAGGSGATIHSQDGSAGREYQTTIPVGVAGSGGGGGFGAVGSGPGGIGGNYGGGGAGGGGTGPVGAGYGAPGAIIILYRPAGSDYETYLKNNVVSWDDLQNTGVFANLSSWGYNIFGELGQGTITPLSSPVAVGKLSNWRSVSCGVYHTAAVKTDGTLWTWGYNSDGRLGQLNTTWLSDPTIVGGLTNWRSVSCGGSHTAAVKTDGTLWTWGRNDYGQLGQLNTIWLSSPTIVPGLTNWKSVSGGDLHNAAVKTDGTLWTWGDNSTGQLGLAGNVTPPLSGNQSSPTQVGGLTNWRSVSCGAHTAAVKTDGTLWTWGRNDYGQLGQNISTSTYLSSPTQVGLMTNWRSVSCGVFHTAAVKTDGTLWCWGTNDYGQLGLGNVVLLSSPVQVGGLTNWLSVSCGWYHTAAVKTDGTLWIWGYNNSYGGLGLGDITNRSSPVQVGLLTNWRSVSCGYYYTTAITWPWTYNSLG